MCCRRFSSGQCQLLYETCSWTSTSGPLYDSATAGTLAPFVCVPVAWPFSSPGIQRASFKAHISAGVAGLSIDGSTTIKRAAPTRSRFRDLFLGLCSHPFCAAAFLHTLSCNIHHSFLCFDLRVFPILTSSPLSPIRLPGIRPVFGLTTPTSLLRPLLLCDTLLNLEINWLSLVSSSV